jgi:tripartite-type tricarboxylate transporter receptor subunit TctC
MTRLTRRQVCASLIAWSGGRSVAAPSAASRPAWPARPLRLLVAYPPGGVSDGIARALARHVAQASGVAVVVDNRPGSGGVLALTRLMHAAADGHTLCFSAVSPLLAAPVEPARIAPVCGVMYTPVLLVATPALAVRRFADVVAAAREAEASKRPLRWATSGSDTLGHLVLRAVESAAGIRVVHVPYKGGGQQLTDALGGQFELLSTNVGEFQLEQIRLGRFIPLAVGAPARLPVLPEVPTFDELAVPQANLASLFGIFAPAGTPAPIVARLNALFTEALQQPDIAQRLTAVSNLPAVGSASDFSRQVDEQLRLQRRAGEMAEPRRP